MQTTIQEHYSPEQCLAIDWTREVEFTKRTIAAGARKEVV